MLLVTFETPTFVQASDLFQRALYMCSEMGGCKKMLRNAIVDSSLKSIQMYLMVQSLHNKLLGKKIWCILVEIFLKNPFLQLNYLRNVTGFLKCVFTLCLWRMSSRFFPHWVLLLFPAQNFSSTNVCVCSFISKGVNTAHVHWLNTFTSTARWSAALRWSRPTQQPGLRSVRAESAPKVASASITVHFAFGNKTEKNRRSHTVTDTILSNC